MLLSTPVSSIKNQPLGTEGRYIIHILVSQVLVTLLGDILRGFLRLIDILQGPADAETCHFDFELVAKESNHVFKAHTRNDGELVT
jgi:hypothetical protein